MVRKGIANTRCLRNWNCLQIVAEDDGCIKFYNDPNKGFVFDSGWAENIIDIIQKAIDFCDFPEEDDDDRPDFDGGNAFGPTNKEENNA